ncbi:hypothetical protein [Streptomyces sp. NPDC051561]|uniref:hypothetical protein n=1 Tax=Streptomyces sp. NPDC051561 TaxID=3365658 RepID=UPI00379C6442
MPDIPTGSTAPWLRGFGLGALAGVPTSLLATVLIASIWHTCHIGPIGLGMMLGAPLFWFLTTALWVLTLGPLSRFGSGRATALALLLNVLLLWLLVSTVGAINDYPSLGCPPDNVPPWWPAFIPI